MRRAMPILAGAVLLLASFGVSAQKDDQKEVDTLIKAVRFLEQKPFDKDAKDVRAWAIKW
jgi:hypothetical protein